MPDTVSLLPGVPAHRPLRVLLVDDTPTDRELAREVFDGHSHQVEIDTCASGARALSFLRQPDTMTPDVILLDLNMPGMSGFEVLTALKGDPQLTIIPVVILSSSGHERDVREAYSLHASSYMVKNVDFGKFIQQIDAFVTFWQQARTIHWPS